MGDQVPLSEMMPYHKDTWQRAVKKYNLNSKDYPYEKVRWGILAALTMTPWLDALLEGLLIHPTLLRERAFASPQLAQFEFADATFACDYDNFSDTTKIRKAGFYGQVLSPACPVPVTPAMLACHAAHAHAWHHAWTCLSE